MGDPKRTEQNSGISLYTSALRKAGPIFGSGIQLAATVVIMFFVGRYLDRQFGTEPWLMIVGILFGFAAGLYNFVKIVQRTEKKKD